MDFTRRILLPLLGLVLLLGCNLNNDCEEIGNIDFSHNEFPSFLILPADTLMVGSTFEIKVSVPMTMTDSDSVLHSIEGLPEIWIRFIDQEAIELLDTITIDKETLHAKFDEHFEEEVILGESDGNVMFRYRTELLENEYQLKIQYSAMQSGVYLIDVGYEDDNIQLSDNLGFEEGCINFHSPKLFWNENDSNLVEEYYEQDDPDNSYRFVLKVM